MAIIGSIFAGVSGLQSHQSFMDLIGNNISNVNTIGFKAGRMTFQEVFALTLRGASRPANTGGKNPFQLGAGTTVASIDTMFSQGQLESTELVTDLAIQGKAFFILNDGNRELYTRAGAFTFDANGTLVKANNGYKLQGKLADAQGTIPVDAAITDLVIPFGQKSAAKATTNISFTGNLSSSDMPKGTILQSQRVYAIEDGDSNVQGLIARNSSTGVVTDIEGVVANATTVSISLGDRNSDNVIDSDDQFDFTYVAVNTDSPRDFYSLNQLVDGINEVLGSTGENLLTASLDSTTGIITFTKTNATDPLIITSTNGNLQRVLETANDASNLTSTTDAFSRLATGDDLLVNLRNSSGVSLGVSDAITAGATHIRIKGRIGGRDLPNTADQSLTVDATTKYSELASKVKRAFNITSEEGDVSVNVDNGLFQITGDGGTDNEIDNVNVYLADATEAAVSAELNNIFDSTPNNWTEKQAASDAEVSASATVFDSLGQQHVLTLAFKKDSKVDNKWFFEVSVNEPAEISGGSTGYILFNTDGSISKFLHDGAATNVSFNPKSGSVNPVTIDLNVGTAGGFQGVTQLGASSSLVASDQDGYGLGELDSISVSEKGEITGSFTNGVNQLIGQLLLATFNNPEGLVRVGESAYVQSANSGTPIRGAAVTAIPSSITPGALEQSNVELAQEFTNMIIAQRGFQASARVVTVSDQFLTEIVNLKT